MSTPRFVHYAAVLCILRYIKGTLFHGLHFSLQFSLELRAYADAEWVGIPLTVALPHVITSYWVPLLSLGVARNNLLFLTPVLKVSTVLLSMPPLNSSGFVGS